MARTTSRPAPFRCCLLCSFIRHDLSQAFAIAKRKLTGKEIAYVTREAYRIPDSDICLKALDLVATVSSDFLLHHCLRSYAFGAAMAHKVDHIFDREVLFLGAIMHDLGLSEEYNGTQSFELDGALAARNFCNANGYEGSKSDLVHEMVALHNAVGKAHKLDPEIALLHYGAGADVAGLWLGDLHKDTLKDILAEYPRLDFKTGFSELMTEQIKKKPRSYMSTMMKMGFINKMQKVPF